MLNPPQQGSEYSYVLQKRASFPTQGLYLAEFWRFCTFFHWKHKVLGSQLELLHSPNHVTESPDTFMLYQTCQKSQLHRKAGHFVQQLFLGENLERPAIFHCSEGSHGLHLCSKLKRAGCVPGIGV